MVKPRAPEPSVPWKVAEDRARRALNELLTKVPPELRDQVRTAHFGLDSMNAEVKQLSETLKEVLGMLERVCRHEDGRTVVGRAVVKLREATNGR